MAPLDLRMVSQRFAEVDGQIVTVRSGTIVSDLSANVDVLVTLDNDPSGAVVSAQGLNYPLASGTRVQLLAYPARGLVVLGSLTDLDSGWLAIGSGVGVAPAFAGTWTNYGGGFAPAAIRKRGTRVTMRGLVKDGTVNSLIFTLPVGWRPTAGTYLLDGTGAAKNLPGTVSAFTGQTDSDSTGSSAANSGNTVAGGTNHSHTITHNHGHQHAIDHTHTGTVTVSGESPIRFDIGINGTVTQISGASTSYFWIGAEFDID